jgi:cellulose synthase/poly-beta-1,6-N-acetylglucosamine synthase-like glycosyltransferase
MRTDPLIAVLIPAHNEETTIIGTINALLAADFPKADIYVVDDRSTDRTAAIVRNEGVNIFKLPQNSGKARAQIAAIRHFKLCVKYDWIIFLDGDTKVDLGFCTAMFQAAVERPDVALFVGQVKSVKNDHLFSASRAVEYAYGHDMVKHGQSNFGVIMVSPGCASMYSTSMLRKVRIDHLTLAEDMDLTIQVHRHGGKVEYLPHAVVHTQDPNNLKDYHKQIMRWYRGFWQVVMKHKVLSPFHRKQRVDWYMLFMLIDALVFNRIVWFLGALAALPVSLLTVFGLDLLASGLVALYGAYKTKRTDVLYRLPQSYLLNYLSFYAYVRSFVEIVILRKELLAWNKVARYNFDQPQTKGKS